MKSTHPSTVILPRALLACFIPFCLTSQVNSQSSTWTTGGPYEGGEFKVMVMAPSNPDIIYAGELTGILKTTDGGTSWQKMSDSKVIALSVAQNNPDLVYAGSFRGGILKSEDGGLTWQEEGLDGATVNAIALHPDNSDVVFAGTGEPWTDYDSEVVGIFKTENGGDTWQQKTVGAVKAVISLLIDTNDSNYIYAGVHPDVTYPASNQNVIRRSFDGGENFGSGGFLTLQGSSMTVALAMTPGDHYPASIYAVVWNGDVHKSEYSATGLFRGVNWSGTNAPGSSANGPWALAVDPNDPQIVYASAGTFFKSADGGGTWSIPPTGHAAASIVIHPASSEVTICSPGGFYRSTNLGESWVSLAQDIVSADISYLAVHPTVSETVFAVIPGDTKQLTVTTDGGAHWNVLENSPTDLGAVAVDPQTPSTVWVGDGYQWAYSHYVHKSTDGGDAWFDKRFASTSVDRNMMEVSDILIHPEHSDYILVASKFLVSGVIYGEGVLARSLDGGNAWSQLSFSTTAMSFDPNDPGIVYAGKARIGQLFRYEDVWGSWTRTTITPTGGIGDVRDIEVDLESRVFVAASDGLWRWDGSWKLLPDIAASGVTVLAIDHSSSPGIVYAGTTSEGVFLSEDSGNTWASFNEGLTNLKITRLVLSEGFIYAGTSYGGVWKRQALKASGVGTEDPENELPSEYSLSQNHPNPFNPTTTIRIDLPETAHVRLAVYDILGHVVFRLESGTVPAGRHRYAVDASMLPSGVYLYRLETATFSQSRRMMLLR